MTTGSPCRVAGAVLVGGASRRMGVDKASLEVDGRPLAVTACSALLGAGISPVAVVGGASHPPLPPGVKWLPDRWPGEGPLGGILTALRCVAAENTGADICRLVGVGETGRTLLFARPPYRWC